MTEKPEIAEAGVEAVSGIDPAAIGLALAAASRERADTFLAEQTRLVRLQAEELSHELDVRRWSLWVRHLSGLLKLTFEIGLAMVAMGVACFIAAAVWNAAHADGLVVEPFSVPPDLANRGITGQVLASQMLDQLTIMQNITESSRVQKSFANSWGADLKVEIPETGVSIGEAYRFLRIWLGHETHVTGELYRMPGGLAITARTGGNSGTTFSGADSDLDTLILKSAEQVYRTTQPDRYARYLFLPRPGLTPRTQEARAILQQMAMNAPPAERPWAWIGLGILARYEGDFKAAVFACRKAISASPDLAVALTNLAVSEMELSHPEAALSAAQKTNRLLVRNSVAGISPRFIDSITIQNRYVAAISLSEYQKAFALARSGTDLDQYLSLASQELFQDRLAYSLSLLHDGAGVREFWTNAVPPEAPLDKAERLIARLRIEGALEHYREVATSEAEVEKTVTQLLVNFSFKDVFESQLRPLLALARAKLGDIRAAQALMAATPGDCYDCLEIRGMIAAIAKQPELADHWFAGAVQSAPAIPKAYSDWGKIILERGQPDAAITKFVQANEKGPHFADPLVYWGEALMAKNQSHLALAKFAAAEQYAPNWGRLHLKWGEALFYAGKKAEAQKHFTRATQLDLTPTEKSELARARAHA